MLNASLKFLRKKSRAFSLYRSKLGLGGTVMFALSRIVTPKGRLIRVKIAGGGVVYLRNGFYDIKVFSQIFIHEDLNFKLPSSSPTTIIDCGANIGLSTLYFKFKYPQVKIISVEPESSNFELLKKNTALYNDIFLLKKGIWNKSCDLYLIDTGEGHASFRVSEVNPQENVIGKIEAVTISDIMKQFKLPKTDLVKMDIEGSEYYCFNGNYLEWADKTACVAVEIHENMQPGSFSLIYKALAHYRHQTRGEYQIFTAQHTS